MTGEIGPVTTGAAIMPRCKDEYGNDTMLFGEKPIRAAFDRGPRPMLALLDVLAVCGLHAKNTARNRLDLGGVQITHPFGTSGGRQELRVVDLDDAYRIALQGRSDACKRFRDFVVGLLRALEGGATIVPAAPAVAGNDGDALISLLLTQSAHLKEQAAANHGAVLAIAELARRSAATESRVDELERRLSTAEARRLQAAHAARALPAPTVAVPTKTRVDMVEQLLRSWCGRNDVDYAWGYRRLYEEIRTRLKYDVRARAKKYPSGMSKLKILRTEAPAAGTLEDFHEGVYALAYELFPPDGPVDAAAVPVVSPPPAVAARPELVPAPAADPPTPAPPSWNQSEEPY